METQKRKNANELRPTISARFTKEKKELIQDIAKARNVSVSDVIRAMVMNQLNQFNINSLKQIS